jgi:hypothetical protein
MDDVKAGVYRHYKGPLYLLLGIAHDANADTLATVYSPSGDGRDLTYHYLTERIVVVYIGLQLDDAHTGPRLAVRTYDDFFALVTSEGDRCPHALDRSSTWCSTCDRRLHPRFTYIGPTWEG